MDETPRQMRLSTTTRGVIIGALIALYAWRFDLPGSMFAQMFLVGAVVQGAVIVTRRFVPAGSMPQAMFVIEMIADGITVLMFALAVFGGIWRAPQEL